MAQFVVHLADERRELLEEDLVRAHVDYLRRLKADGVLPFCGPCEDGTAIMILSCSSRDEAETLVEADPFTAADYYQDRRIVEVEEATPENDFLLDDALAFLG